MSKVIDFYSKVVKSLGMNITSDGFIKQENKNVVLNQLPMVLPVQEQLNHLTEANDYGEYIPIKTLFNPLKENLVKKDSLVTKHMMRVLEANINFQATMATNLLLELGRSEDHKNLSLRLNKFLILLEHTKTGNTKELINDSMINVWRKLIESKHKFIKIFLKKNVKKEGEKYFRGIVISSPLLDAIEDGTDLPAKLTGKQIRVIKVLINYIMHSVKNSEDNVLEASNNAVSPTLMVVLKAYKKSTERLNKLLKELEIVDKNIASSAMLEILYEYDDLDFSKYEHDLVTLPEITENGINEMDTSLHNPQQPSPVQHSQPDNNQPPSLPNEPAVNNSDVMSEEEVQRMLNGTYAPPPPVQNCPPQPRPGLLAEDAYRQQQMRQPPVAYTPPPNYGGQQQYAPPAPPPQNYGGQQPYAPPPNYGGQQQYGPPPGYGQPVYSAGLQPQSAMTPRAYTPQPTYPPNPPVNTGVVQQTALSQNPNAVPW